MPGARHAGTVRPMLTSHPTASVTCSDLRYRAGHLTHAAELMRQVVAGIPGPETRTGFMGLVRDHFDAMVRDKVALITEAEHQLIGAARQLRALADDAERAVQGAQQ